MSFIYRIPITEQQLRDSLQSAELAEKFASVEADIAKEQDERISADSALIDKINSETSARQADVSNLQTSIRNESTLRASQVSSLQTSLNSESTLRASQVSSLQTSLNSESTLRASQVSSLQTALNNEVTLRASQVSSLQTSLNNEVTLRANQFSSLQSSLSSTKTDLNNEVTLRASQFSSLQSSLSSTKTDLNNEVTLRANQISSLQSSLSSTKTDLNNEVTLRANQISSLQSSLSSTKTDLNNEVTLRASQVSSLQSSLSSTKTDLNNEVTLRNSQTSSLQTALNNEVTLRNSQTSSLQTALNNEVTLRNSQTSSLQTALNNEVTLRNSQTSSLQTALNNEVTLRNSQTSSLQTALNNEVTLRNSQTSSLQTALNNEVTLRNSQTSSLQTALNNEVTLRNSQIESLKSAVETISAQGSNDSLKRDLLATIEAEEDARIAADRELESSITAVIFDIGTEQHARQWDIDSVLSQVQSEANVRTEHDDSLKTAINNEVTLRAAQFNTLQNSVQSALNIPDFTPSTSSKNGTRGLVPAPPKTSEKLLLTQNGWVDYESAAPITTLSVAQSTFSQKNSLTFNGSMQSVSINGYDSTVHFIDGTTSASDAGTYQAYVYPATNKVFSDGTTEPRTVTWYIDPLRLAKPSISNTDFTFDSYQHSPTISDFNSTYENKSGTDTASDAGLYRIKFSLKNIHNTTWEDGTIDNLQYPWEIHKATRSFDVDVTSLSWSNTDSDVKTVTITADSDTLSEITIYNPISSYLEVSRTDNILTFTPLSWKPGRNLVTITLPETDDYDSFTKTITCAVNYIPPLSDTNLSWATVKALLTARNGDNIFADWTQFWQVGDRKAVNSKGVLVAVLVDADTDSNVLTFAIRHKDQTYAYSYQEVAHDPEGTMTGTYGTYMSSSHYYSYADSYLPTYYESVPARGNLLEELTNAITPRTVSSTYWVTESLYKDDTRGVVLGSKYTSQFSNSKSNQKLWAPSVEETIGTKAFEFFKNGNGAAFFFAINANPSLYWTRDVWYKFDGFDGAGHAHFMELTNGSFNYPQAYEENAKNALRVPAFFQIAPSY